MLGETITTPMAKTAPTVRPVTMPPALKRFQNRANRSTGKLLEATTAKASTTRWAMFCFSQASPSTMPTAPMPRAESRAILICSFWSEMPSRSTFT